MPYIGRFAPSPTGPLHFGSLVTALASFLDARAHKGDWLVRMEDIDPLRDTPEAADAILRSLKAHGLQWDGEVRYQSDHHDLYRQRLAQLKQQQNAYGCPCSRKELQASGGRHLRGCRPGFSPDSTSPVAVRFALSNRSWNWMDVLLGPQTGMMHAGVDDFVLQRKEGFFAYQLAVVADDIDQGVTHVVRGSDLLDSTIFQLALYEAFAAPPPVFLHLPVITLENGQKLSKQTFAEALDDGRPAANLAEAFSALNHPLPPALAAGPVSDQLAWGQANWSRDRLPPTLAIRRDSIRLTR